MLSRTAGVGVGLVVLCCLWNSTWAADDHYMDMVNSIAQGRSFYTVLDVAQGATAQEIKKAYRQMALKYHPDKNKDPRAIKLFQEISKANEILSDSALRQQYNELLRSGIPLMDRYYHRHVHNYGLPKHDIRIVVAVLLLVITLIKYLSDLSKYNRMRRAVMQDSRYKNWARSNGYQIGEGFRFVDMEPPSWKSLVIVQLIMLPLRIFSLFSYIRRRIYWYRNPPKTRQQTEAMMLENGWTQQDIDRARQLWGARVFGPDERKLEREGRAAAQTKTQKT